MWCWERMEWDLKEVPGDRAGVLVSQFLRTGFEQSEAQQSESFGQGLEPLCWERAKVKQESPREQDVVPMGPFGRSSRLRVE